ncbi:MAG: hypothetical protein MJ076_01690 [Clostridia bacterium]|nr:hypothetical protein [Clostridia bacterium]
MCDNAIGNIKEDQLPSAKLIAVMGSKPLGNKSSNNSIPTQSENVKKKSKVVKAEENPLLLISELLLKF